jgi:hypothetical protein
VRDEACPGRNLRHSGEQLRRLSRVRDKRVRQTLPRPIDSSIRRLPVRFVTPSPGAMTTNQAAPAVRREIEPTHPCIRCGREGVPADAGLCELCNPLELAQPSATQMHGIAAVGIIAFIAILAVLSRVAIAGTGPFTGSVTGVTPVAGGLAITIHVTNEGRNAAATVCEVAEAPVRVGAPVETVQLPLVPAGQSIDYVAVVSKLGTATLPLAADCQSP